MDVGFSSGWQSVSGRFPPVPFFSASKLIRLSQDPGIPKRATHAQTIMPDLTHRRAPLSGIQQHRNCYDHPVGEH